MIVEQPEKTKRDRKRMERSALQRRGCEFLKEPRASSLLSLCCFRTLIWNCQIYLWNSTEMSDWKRATEGSRELRICFLLSLRTVWKGRKRKEGVEGQ